MRTIWLCEGEGELGVAHCVMAATSVIAGEKFSDSPHCVCPLLTGMLIHINDSCPSDAVRNRLLGHLPWLLIGTRSIDMDVPVERFRLFRDFMEKLYEKIGVPFDQREVHVPPLESRMVGVCNRWITGRAAHFENAAANEDFTHLVSEEEYHEGWEQMMKPIVDFIENELIPVYWTAPIEPDYSIENLITQEV